MRSAVFSPDGAKIISASRDKTARLWLSPQAIYTWLGSEACPLPALGEEEIKEYGLDQLKK